MMIDNDDGDETMVVVVAMTFPGLINYAPGHLLSVLQVLAHLILTVTQ